MEEKKRKRLRSFQDSWSFCSFFSLYLGGGSVLVDDLVALPLGGLAVGEDGDELLDDLELSAEEGVLGLVDLVLVHPQELEVDAGHGLDEALVGGGELELAEEAGAHGPGGGAGEADLLGEEN